VGKRKQVMVLVLTSRQIRGRIVSSGIFLVAEVGQQPLVRVWDMSNVEDIVYRDIVPAVQSNGDMVKTQS
jgi:hypothetical protein